MRHSLSRWTFLLLLALLARFIHVDDYAALFELSASALSLRHFPFLFSVPLQAVIVYARQVVSRILERAVLI